MNAVSVCLCTCGRPKMLAECLDSLGRINARLTAELRFVIVDNDPEGGARHAVTAFAACSPYPTHYVHEPRRGISFARNASVDRALALGADWLAFIDDDERVEPGWLDALLKAAHSYAADVVCGPVKLVYPDKLPFWAVPEVYKAGSILPEGTPMRTAATCNTLALARLFRPAPQGLGLRFGEELGLSGSEDTVLFSGAVRAGARVFFTDKAVVSETVPVSRLTYRRVVQSSYRRGTMYRHELTIKGVKQPLARSTGKAASRFLAGALLGLTLPLHAVLGPLKFKHAAIRTGRNFAFSAGVAAALMGRRSNYYIRIDGF